MSERTLRNFNLGSTGFDSESTLAPFSIGRWFRENIWKMVLAILCGALIFLAGHFGGGMMTSGPQKEVEEKKEA